MPTETEIRAAIENLSAREDKVTVRSVWSELGSSGSFTTITPVLAAWRAGNAGKTASGTPVPASVTESAIALVTKCWALAEKKAASDAQDARSGADARIMALQSEVDGLQLELEKADFDAGELTLLNSKLQETLTSHETAIVEQKAEIAASAREIALLRERIKEMTPKTAAKAPHSSPQKRAPSEKANGAVAST